jgi:hypothetical protein
MVAGSIPAAPTNYFKDFRDHPLSGAGLEIINSLGARGSRPE